MPPKPENCCAVVLTYPYHALSVELSLFLLNSTPRPTVRTRFFLDASARHHAPLARNKSIADALAQEEISITHFLLFDWDSRPVIEPKESSKKDIRPWLEADGDIVGAVYPTGNEHAWDGTTVHMGCLRVARAVFEKLPQPWFAFEYSADGKEVLKCECTSFTERAKIAGFSIVQAGYCGHWRGV